MDNPGPQVLAALQIGAAKSISLLTPIIDLEGMQALNLEASFQYGAGGATCSAIVAVSMDSGTTWRHVARFDFTTATAVKWCNLSGLASKGVTAYQDLASEGVTDGLLSDQIAVYIVSTGTYTGTVLTVRGQAR